MESGNGMIQDTPVYEAHQSPHVLGIARESEVGTMSSDCYGVLTILARTAR